MASILERQTLGKMEGGDTANMGKYNYIEYLKLVLREAWKETISLYFKDWRVPASNLVSIALSIWILYLWKGAAIMTDEWAVIASGLIGAVGGFGIVYLMNLLIVVPARLYQNKKQEAELFTTKAIEVIAFNTGLDDVRPSGILVTNKKGIDISCFSQILRAWSGKTELRSAGLPSGLVWYEDGFKKNQAYTLLRNGVPELIVLERARTEEDFNIITLHAKSVSGIDLGESAPIVGANLRVYEAEPLTIEVEFRFTISGFHLETHPLRFIIKYQNEKLKIEKLDHWKK